MKSLIKQLIGGIISMIINALMTLIATSIVNMIYNKYAIKKPMCILCGSTGKRLVNGEYVKCSCRK